MKKYLDQNVFDAAQDRLAFIFDNFDNIYVSFSGGKDSGLLLNLVVKYMRENGIDRKIGVFHQDFEAQYSETTSYVTRELTSNLDILKPYWLCLPMSVNCATSMTQSRWVPWSPADKEIWTRDLPNHEGVITLDNHEFSWYVEGMPQEDVYRAFGPWYREACGGGKTIGLLGLRADESLNRWRAVSKVKESSFECRTWTTGISEEVWSGSPLYDWTVEDVWTANARFGFDYNKLYDLFFMADIPPHAMRVASPFNDQATSTLKLYRAVEPHMWARLVGRVNGANFASVYGGTTAMGWKSITLPKGHTWKSYVTFLLSTLPPETRANYEAKFSTSIEFWRTKGGVLSDETIDELRACGIELKPNGESNYKTNKTRIVFDDYPDDADVSDFKTVPSYKRMAVCIMKNDHLCKYMGFSLTKAEHLKRNAAIERYKAF